MSWLWGLDYDDDMGSDFSERSVSRAAKRPKTVDERLLKTRVCGLLDLVTQMGNGGVEFLASGLLPHPMATTILLHVSQLNWGHLKKIR